MWYNTIPPFIPMDPNMYSMYYSRIKGPNPLFLITIFIVNLQPYFRSLQEIFGFATGICN